MKSKLKIPTRISIRKAKEITMALCVAALLLPALTTSTSAHFPIPPPPPSVEVTPVPPAPQNRRVWVGHSFRAFDGPRFRAQHMGTFPPQYVTVLAEAEEQPEWVQISTYRGPLWVNLGVQPPIEELEAFMAQFGNTVSVFYENFETGFVFSHNGEQVYFGASATKAPFALYIYKKTEQGQASMYDVHSYQRSDFWEGSGIIRHRYQLGQTFTQRRLLELMLAPSDNIATRILRRVHGLDDYRDFVYSLGANPNFVQNLTYSYLSANDAGIFIRAFWDYIQSDGRYAQEFNENLLANRYPFITSDYPVASKSGWAANFGGAWHDMAIVYAPSPYGLAILSSRAGNANDRVVYGQISMFIQEFNTRWFGD